jgi:hypothetical protein|tara:strand:+ start:100 stop:393 length:294 start_codon:yes stop_codon:yes gene_type:complete
MTKVMCEEAQRIALDYIQQQDCDVELVLIEDETLTEEFGWVFFYNTRKFQETGDFRDMVGGNAPIIVDNISGKITETGTTHDIEYYIEEYRINRNCK